MPPSRSPSPQPSEDNQQPQRPYPKKVLFIIGNEFCERFSYYGLRTVLVLYFKNVLGFSDANSTVSFHLFATLCYMTPLLGAILGDSVWGKFKTTLYLSLVYFIGEIILVLASIFWNTPGWSIGTTFIGLTLIGIGTGGIKPCVSALGGDQFLPNEEKWRQNFFSLFYGAINLGSLVSMFVTPMLRSGFRCVNRMDCYPYAFGVPCLLMLVSIVVFLVAKNHYNLVPLPEKNVLLMFCQCVWLALKRKLTGYRLPGSKETQKDGTRRTPPLPTESASSSTSVSVSSNEAPINAAVVPDSSENANNPSSTKTIQRLDSENEEIQLTQKQIANNAESHKHWLYLASDRFDSKSIEEFRTVLSILLLFVPIPVYWCLFDQQSTLWTLQATRMNGRIFNNSFVLQPDQMAVANPLLLLAAIPVFDIFIYPALGKCNLLRRPIQRITVGGLLAALTFVVSAMIELRIQEYLPPTAPPSGKANLLLVNGLSECSLVNPVISYVQIPGVDGATLQALSNTTVGITNFTHPIPPLQPLNSHSMDVLSADASFLNNYQLKFKLADDTNKTALGSVGCPFDHQKDYDLSFGPFPDQSTRLLYLEQGNGKLTYKTFNESLELPKAGKARVRLLYEFFGSWSNAERRQFNLVRSGSNQLGSFNDSMLSKAKAGDEALRHAVFKTAFRDGQVLVSGYLDIDVSSKGESFVLKTDDNLIGAPNSASIGHALIKLEPGTRNLIIVHQKDATNFQIKQLILQDNSYRISLLWQLVPYLMISMSEVMFSITGLEFSYAMAPESMKSVILGAWSLTTAFGNMLTVVVEYLHLFDNIAHDFLFYSAIMAVDMVVFAFIGSLYKRMKPHNEKVCAK